MALDNEPTTEVSDEDIVRDEEDREALLVTQKSGVRRLFNRERDPNAPRPVELSRKDLRKQRRRERRARRRRRRGEDEAALMFEMEGGEDNDDDSSSTSSNELFLEKKQPRQVRRRLFQFTIIAVLLISLLGLLTWGAYKMSSGSKRLQKTKTLKSNGTHGFAPTTLLISIDGFRADYKDRGLTKHLNRLIAQGVSPAYMRPSFPSVTFSNHVTFLTGLYIESHGVVSNRFFDVSLNEEFHNTDPAITHQPRWWPSKNLFSTCEEQGVSTASLMWPGGESGIEPEPSIIDKYNGTETLSRKVDRVLGLLDRPSTDNSAALARSEARPELIALYVPNVDQDGHLYGPNSTKIRTTISEADSMIGDLLEGLEQRNLTEIVNIILVSDHGMATTSNDRLIQLEDFIDVGDIEHFDGWPLYGLRPFAHVDIHSMYEKLLSASLTHQHFDVYLRENMPPKWHFSDSDRIAPIWVIPHAGWAVVHKADFDVKAAKKDGTIYHPRGLHGYDNFHPLMRAIFVARGPAFPHEPNSRLDVFQNVEIYNIVCDTLGVDPQPNNGTLRLPLKTIGLHSEQPAEDPPADLPPYSSETSSMAPTVSPTRTPMPTSTASDKPQNGGTEGEEEEQKPHHGGGFWDWLIGKINKAREWLADLRGSKTKSGDVER